MDVLSTNKTYIRVIIVISSNPLIQFYDTRSVGYPTSPNGQFISDYFITTFLSTSDNTAINLIRDEPAWTLSSDTVNAIKAWIKSLNM